jgi:DNA-binding FadR family transcriptional regulator
VPATSEIPAAGRRSTSEKIADDIRTYIQREGLLPGDRLGREEDLARTFGVSRPTLREALRLLSSAHLIRASKGPGGGIFVAATPEEGIALSVSDSVASMLATDAVGLDELLEARMLVEVPLAGLAAQRATEEDIRGLTELLAQATEAGTIELAEALGVGCSPPCRSTSSRPSSSRRCWASTRRCCARSSAATRRARSARCASTSPTCATC